MHPRSSPGFQILAETAPASLITSALACHASQLAYENSHHWRRP